MTARTNSRGGLGILILAMVAWGSTIVTIKVASRGLPVLALTLIELVSALAVLAGLVVLRRTRPGRPSWGLVLAGILEPGLTYPLINGGLARTSGTHGALIIGLESVLVVILGAARARTRLSRRVVVALLLAVAGTALLVGGGGGTATPLGDLLVFAGVMTAALYVITAQRESDTFDALTLTFYQFLFGTVATLPIVAVALAADSSGFAGHASFGEFSAAVSTGVVGSALAFILYNWALSRITTVLAGTSLTLIPLFGIVLSVIFLSETVTVQTVVAAGLVITGVSLTAGRESSDTDEQLPGNPPAPRT